MKSWRHRTLYELLEVDPHASDEAVRHAIHRTRRELAPGSVALYSILTSEERGLLNERLDEAQRVLSDPVTRRAYDRSIGLKPGHVAGRSEIADDDETPAVSSSPHDTEITGAHLARAREARGLTVERLATMTRIRPPILEALESENRNALPQKVFVRGFVITYAREVGLDPDQTWRDLAPRLGF